MREWMEDDWRQGETRDAWKKKDDKGKEYHRRKEEEGRRKPQRDTQKQR